MTPVWMALGVGLLAGLGAQLRYLAELALTRLIQPQNHPRFPWATLLVNVIGSAMLGALGGAVLRMNLDPIWLTLLGTGFAGGLTTFSTWSFETVQLWKSHKRIAASLNIIANIMLSVTGSTLGFFLTTR